MLDVGAGHRVSWECCGNPDGTPALYVHGGPGSGAGAGARRYFDPAVYRVVLFDQRGCGRSRPSASDADADLADNTTQHLISDIERLRRHLAVDRWTILAVSWGTTLALAYAHAYPERVRSLILAAVTTTSRREVEWITHDVGRVFPREWSRFAAAVPVGLRDMPIVDAYATMLFDADRDVQEHAAREWCRWEDAHVSLAPDHSPDPRFSDPAYRLGFARLVTHYWRHSGFLEEDQLLREAARLNGIPGILIHGRFDVSSPLETAWRLSRTWRGSELRVVDAAHGGNALSSAIVDALRSEGARK